MDKLDNDIKTEYFGKPSECVGQFDFNHNMYYYIPFTNEIKSANKDEFDALYAV